MKLDKEILFVTIPNISMTDKAAQRIADLISWEETVTPLRFRISVSGGGCSGFQYHFTLDDAQTADDHVFEKNGVFLIIDAISLSLMSDAMVDYVEDLTSAQFVVKNPNATAACGCGKSFSV